VPRRGPKPAMSVPAIARVAVALADEEGLDAVSMASVAKRLGFTAMSLYRYVDTKDDLLQVMLDAAYGPVTLPAPEPGDGWRSAATAWARALLDRCRAHPWLVDVRMSSPPLTPHSVGWMDAGLRALGGTGLGPQQVASSLLILDGYVRSHVRLLHEYSEEGLRTWSTRLRSVIDEEATPTVWMALQADVFDDEPAEEGPWPSDDFVFGLEIVLGGIEQLVEGS
ncbi:TetR/AcrR family transcriptional regulator, partial [Nocardioides sp. CER28]